MERNVPTAVVESRLNGRSLCNRGVHSSVGLKCSNCSDYSVPVCMRLVELGFFKLVFLSFFYSFL